MDEFLRDIHTLLFKEWILIQSIEGCNIKEEGKKVILTTPYCHAEVIFNDHNLIELSVTNLVTDNLLSSYSDSHYESCHFFIYRNASMY